MRNLEFKDLKKCNRKRLINKMDKIRAKNDYIDLLKLYKQEDQKFRSMMRVTNKVQLNKDKIEMFNPVGSGSYFNSGSFLPKTVKRGGKLKSSNKTIDYNF
mmetsp:Transcript_16329/g.14250  ORF Transcript_16329/g.14250 Transcript_16329/m.14250 type:complete len:101 (-) Transcript_16329:14-316(-)